MPPALTNAHTLEKSSQMENFLTQHDSMPPALTNAKKSSQMENFLTQHDSIPPALTNAHNAHTLEKWRISSPSNIPYIESYWVRKFSICEDFSSVYVHL